MRNQHRKLIVTVNNATFLCSGFITNTSRTKLGAFLTLLWNGVSLNDVFCLAQTWLTIYWESFSVSEPSLLVWHQISRCFKYLLMIEDHRNFIRYLQYRNNDPDSELVDYRMRVHVFGNRSSPAIAGYGLRRTAEDAESTLCDRFCKWRADIEGVIEFLEHNEHILHKIASNEYLAKNVNMLDLTKDRLHLQQSLGLGWDISIDSFVFRVSPEEDPCTIRVV